MKYRFGKYEVEPREKTDSVVFKLVKHAQDVDRAVRILSLCVVLLTIAICLEHFWSNP